MEKSLAEQFLNQYAEWYHTQKSNSETEEPTVVGFLQQYVNPENVGGVVEATKMINEATKALKL